MYNREILFNNRSNFLGNDEHNHNKASELSIALGDKKLSLGGDIGVIENSTITYNDHLISAQIKEIFADSIFSFRLISLYEKRVKRPSYTLSQKMKMNDFRSFEFLINSN